MPTISRFLGIIIRMFYSDHNPPHFHAEYNEYEASFSLPELKVLSGELPSKVEGIVKEWAELHTEELLEGWELSKNNKQPKKIKPLV